MVPVSPDIIIDACVPAPPAPIDRHSKPREHRATATGTAASNLSHSSKKKQTFRELFCRVNADFLTRRASQSLQAFDDWWILSTDWNILVLSRLLFRLSTEVHRLGSSARTSTVDGQSSDALAAAGSPSKLTNSVVFPYLYFSCEDAGSKECVASARCSTSVPFWAGCTAGVCMTAPHVMLPEVKIPTCFSLNGAGGASLADSLCHALKASVEPSAGHGPQSAYESAMAAESCIPANALLNPLLQPFDDA
eukprot:2959992-Pleurochrysis_carterae.AAC.1